VNSRSLAGYLAERTALLVAITSNDDISDGGIASVYRGSAADVATVHFSRDTRNPKEGGSQCVTLSDGFARSASPDQQRADWTGILRGLRNGSD
jgi:hypothetical protein